MLETSDEQYDTKKLSQKKQNEMIDFYLELIEISLNYMKGYGEIYIRNGESSDAGKQNDRNQNDGNCSALIN